MRFGLDGSDGRAVAAKSTGGLERRVRPKSRGVAWGELYCVRPAVCPKKRTRHVSCTGICADAALSITATITWVRVSVMMISVGDVPEMCMARGASREFEWLPAKALNPLV